MLHHFMTYFLGPMSLYHCLWSGITGRIPLQLTVNRPSSQTRLHLRLRAFVLGGVH